MQTEANMDPYTMLLNEAFLMNPERQHTRSPLTLVLENGSCFYEEQRLHIEEDFSSSFRRKLGIELVTETDSQTPKTGPRTITEPQQPISEPFVESTELVDSPAPRDTVEVGASHTESFQNLHIGTPLRVKVFA
ncbi:hypothetical protein Y1Q_0016978 [Alligator mississippiensis]|uniref:Uncharacterized protein n=1 Tax=Alligator mississippiensis TaxID=8496 RepID=A0A151N3R1_ALLMI|nr:hypothetical protein Y1Q_0016978 [Alligator mississippiensis]